jgi:hypothetical protein
MGGVVGDGVGCQRDQRKGGSGNHAHCGKCDNNIDNNRNNNNSNVHISTRKQWSAGDWCQECDSEDVG